jgi:hypothetical protein
VSRTHITLSRPDPLDAVSPPKVTVCHACILQNETLVVKSRQSMIGEQAADEPSVTSHTVKGV